MCGCDINDITTIIPNIKNKSQVTKQNYAVIDELGILVNCCCLVKRNIFYCPKT
jgi:hypothetical protein